jgi:hypothetical protein
MQMAGLEPDPAVVLKDESRFAKTLLKFYGFEDTSVPYRYKLENQFVKSGRWALTMDSNYRYSPGFNSPISEFFQKKQMAVRISAEVYATSVEAFSEGNLVISPVHEGKNYRYARLNFGNLKLTPGTWNKVSLDFLVSPDLYPGDKLYAFAWYTGRSVIYIDDLKIEGFERKK